MKPVSVAPPGGVIHGLVKLSCGTILEPSEYEQLETRFNATLAALEYNRLHPDKPIVQFTQYHRLDDTPCQRENLTTSES